METLKHQSHRRSTRRTYYRIWKSFNQFFIRLDVKPEEWESRLTLFVAYLIDQEKCSKTIKSYISAIKAVLREVNVRINEDRVLLNALIRACKLKNDRVTARLPIHKGLLTVMINSMDRVFRSEQPYLVKLYKAIFVTAYYGMFRIGELTEGEHVLKAKDVFLGDNKKKLKFILFTSKTHGKEDKPQVIKINSIDSQQILKDHPEIKLCEQQNYKAQLCPFQILMEYREVRGEYSTDSEQFFIFKDGSPVKPNHVRTILKKLLILRNLNPKLYGTHGFRSGRSVDLLDMGVSVETIKSLGRWKSSAVYSYLKHL